MRKILTIIALALALGPCGCRRECPTDAAPLAGGTPAAIAPVTAPAAGATVAAGPAAVAGSTAAGVTPAAVPASEKEYCASESGDVFHRCSCTSVKRIKPEKLVRFKTRAEALASGRRPCKHCKP